MDVSLSGVILLSITAVIIAAVLGVLSYGADQADDVANQGYQYFQELSSPEELNIDLLSGKSMPVAAVAAFFRSNQDRIASLDCGICHTESFGEEAGDCLTLHLQGRAIMMLSRDGGEYNVTLLPEAP